MTIIVECAKVPLWPDNGIVPIFTTAMPSVLSYKIIITDICTFNCRYIALRYSFMSTTSYIIPYGQMMIYVILPLAPRLIHYIWPIQGIMIIQQINLVEINLPFVVLNYMIQ
ncbi:hypothetical protein ACJX0J_032613 [Zea mays]